MLAVTIVGCSTVEITKLSDSAYSSGLRFYRPEPYLLVTQDNNGNSQTSMISLPNKNEEYVIKPKVRLGTVNVSATLEGGWNLTQLGTTVDTKVPETITAIAGTITAMGAVIAMKKSSLPLEPGLYRIEFDKQTGGVSALKRIN